MKILDRIQKTGDIRQIDRNRLPLLADEIREFLIDKVSNTGGHLASNLGVVELTMVLHRVLELPRDKIIYDVGHQSYVHKILTGRKEGFDSLRQFGGMSGFPKRSESDTDIVDTGHSTTSLSAGLGLVRARDLKGEDYKVVSIIGDGSLTGGMAYEALNNAAELKTNYVMILNDNTMSIAKNVGGMSAYLSNVRTAAAYTGLKMGVTAALERIPRVGDQMVATIRRTKSGIKQLLIPGMLFENLGMTYLGPVDGHNLTQLEKVLREALRVEGPVVVHVLTQKGRGYEPARLHPENFHGVGPFDRATGKALEEKTKPDYSAVFSQAICEIGEKYPKVAAITAAMPSGTGLSAFARNYPDRLFDVGIAEAHAVTFAAGLALGGITPVVCVYSSFLQRAYDQMMHDVCMQNLHVIFALDRAGLVGADGETHQGAFDLSYLSSMPNMQVLAPMDGRELPMMLHYAVCAEGPVAIRYPRGTAWDGLAIPAQPVARGTGQVLYRGRKVALLAVGSMVQTAWETAELLEREGIHVTVVNMRFVKPLDIRLMEELLPDHDCFVTLEDNVITGGFGQQCADALYALRPDIRIAHVAIPDAFVPHGSVNQLRKLLHMDKDSVALLVRELL